MCTSSDNIVNEYDDPIVNGAGDLHDISGANQRVQQCRYGGTASQNILTRI